jgi:hypothetical protein
MTYEVELYQYSWNMTEKIGALRVKYKAHLEWSKWITIKDHTEFLIAVQTLQNEKPVYFIEEKKNWWIQTMAEPVGEIEG